MPFEHETRPAWQTQSSKTAMGFGRGSGRTPAVVRWCNYADKHARGLVNQLQLQLCVWMRRRNRHPGQRRLDHFVRARREARATMHGCSVQRWSIQWLTEVWRYAGHRAIGIRGGLSWQTQSWIRGASWNGGKANNLNKGGVGIPEDSIPNLRRVNNG